MGLISGNELFGRALARRGVDTMFFIMGGPINDALRSAMTHGVRGIDVRHEQAAAMMAHAYARVRGVPGVCLGASGPGTINLTTGIANALIDCVPMVAFGGASPMKVFHTGAFQEIDQVAVMRPVTKWAERVLHTERIPEYVDMAFRQAMSGKPGPVFVDLPGDVLYRTVEEESVYWPPGADDVVVAPPAAPSKVIWSVIEMLAAAKRPVVLSGSGVLWGHGSEALDAFVTQCGIPFYTTPQGRGAVPEDHEYFYGQARSTAFKEADVVLVVGTRLNYVFAHGKSPRFASDAKFIQVDIDPRESRASQRVDVAITGDARVVLEQLLQAAKTAISTPSFREWRTRLSAVEQERSVAAEKALSTDQLPIHPLRLCKELRDILGRDTILCVDGQEILNYGRQSIPSYAPNCRLNSGTFGTMGVGLPFGIGAKAAKPDARVVVLHGDGSFGLNAMELDTAMRHRLPILVVISLNGGWTADPERNKPGRELGYTRFDLIARDLGCYGEYVEKPDDIRPALLRAVAAVDRGQTAVVNVVTDWKARAHTVSFTAFST